MKKININRSTLFATALVLAAGILIGWLIKPAQDHQAEVASVTPDQVATIWTCSMDPQVRQSEPGKCPLCGMDLIPLEPETESGDPLELKMSPTAMQLANVQTAVVGYGMPARELRLNGKVQADERRVYSQVSHLEGRVEQLLVNFTGEPIRQGQKLGTLYSPTLVTAQEELLAARQIQDMQPALFRAAREKLKNWKLSDSQIDNILAAGKAQERFPILADVSGLVMAKKVNLGDYLMRGMPLYDIADLSHVWILFDVYESDMPWVKVGSTVSFEIQALPGQAFTGKVSFIDPVIDPVTRVATARVEMANPGGRFKPEMFASGTVKTKLAGHKESIVVPKSAVLWTGERSVVYVKNTAAQGVQFGMREVTLGPLVGDGYVVTSGLEPGETIAISGAFSIDAAAQLAGKPSMMTPEGGSGSPSTAPAMQSSKAMKAAVQKLFDWYFPLKDALVADNFGEAKNQAASLKKAFEQTSMSIFEGAAHKQWMNSSNAANAALNKISQAGDLEIARSAFKPLSDQMVVLARTFGPFDAAIFVQHCPMADDNIGADWLSLDKVIRNPYFGDKMLKCGSVTETIQ
ncbi:MAG: efflux RND transporter periplasmic adaptor subunit [Saprospiraceae bacterium]|nr:efflux RND transporter periplasmic adaptor subunit [Saprospiraceae bacterium]